MDDSVATSHVYMWLTEEICLWWHPNVFHGNSWRKIWRINTELFIELWNDSDVPTISKLNQELFVYHAEKVPNSNWIISFYNHLGAVVWRTFDLYCIPNLTKNCLTAWSAAFRVIVKGWQSRNAVIYSKVGFIMLRYHFVPVWVLIFVPDLLRSPRDVEIVQWILEAFHRQDLKSQRTAAVSGISFFSNPSKIEKTTTDISFLAANVAPQLQFSFTVNAIMQPFGGGGVLHRLLRGHSLKWERVRRTHVAVRFGSGAGLEPSHPQTELEHEDVECLTSLKSVCVCLCVCVCCRCLNLWRDQSNLSTS